MTGEPEPQIHSDAPIITTSTQDAEASDFERIKREAIAQGEAKMRAEIEALKAQAEKERGKVVQCGQCQGPAIAKPNPKKSHAARTVTCSRCGSYDGYEKPHRARAVRAQPELSTRQGRRRAERGR